MAYQIRLCFSLAYAGCSLKVCSVAASCPRIKLGLLSKFHHGPPLANPYLLFPASFLAMLPTCVFCSGPLLKCTTPVHILLPIHPPACNAPLHFCCPGNSFSTEALQISPGGPRHLVHFLFFSDSFHTIWHWGHLLSCLCPQANRELHAGRGYIRFVSISSTALDLTQSRSSGSVS